MLQQTIKSIIKIPRVLATGFCFAYFFLGGLLISSTILPIIHFVPSSLGTKQRRSRYCVHLVFAQFVAMMSFFHLIKVNIHHRHRIRQAKAGLVIANHPTLIDVVIMISQIPNVGCVVKGELFHNPYLKRVLSYAGFISNENAEALLEGAKRSLAEGLPIVIFPEGSRSIPGEALHFQRGTANIAVRTDAPLLPIFITCKPITLTKGAPWWAVPERRANIDLWVQNWIDSSEMAGGVEDPPAAARRLTKALTLYFEKGLKNVSN